MTERTTQRIDPGRALLTIVTLAVPALLIALSWWAWHAAMPERMAFHWDVQGRVDGTIVTQPVFQVALAGAAVTLIAGAIMLLVPRIDARTRRSAMYWFGAAGAFIAASWLIPAGLTHAAGSAQEARLDGWLAGFIVPFAYGALPWLLTPKAPAPSERAPRPVPLAPTEVGAWSKTIHSGVLYGVAIVLAGAGAAMLALLLAADETGATGFLGLAVMPVAALAVLCFAALRVTVDWRGLRVRSLLLRLPLKRIPLARVSAVEVSELHPGDWGGWGYRVGPGRSALILRAGPGMVVTADDDSRFALTIAEPEVPAGLLHTLAAGPPSEQR